MQVMSHSVTLMDQLYALIQLYLHFQTEHHIVQVVLYVIPAIIYKWLMDSVQDALNKVLIYSVTTKTLSVSILTVVLDLALRLANLVYVIVQDAS